MAVDLPALQFLLRSAESVGSFGETALFGRQRLLLPNQWYRAKVEDALSAYRAGTSLRDIEDGYADRLLDFVGARPLDIVDASPYEGATVIHDLNKPIPAALNARYRTVIDIGTLEHVFNIAQAFVNAAQMIKVGGQFILVNIANNHLGHGFWQFSPEALFRMFCPANGFEPVLANLYHGGKWEPLRDPDAAGRRLPIATNSYTYLAFAARKVEERPLFDGGWPVQSDYRASWIIFEARRKQRAGHAAEAKQLLEEAMVRHPKNPVYPAAISRLLRETGADIGEAKIYSDRALDLAHDHPEVTAERAAVLRELERRADAAATLFETTQAQPEQRRSFELLGNSPASQDRHGDARVASEKTAGMRNVGLTAEAQERSELGSMRENTEAPARAAVPTAGSHLGGASEPGSLISIGGFNVAFDDPRLDDGARSALMNGRYEFKEREIARRLLRPGDRVIELGAGMGVVSMTIAAQVGDAGLLSFEAHPEIVLLARENIARNGRSIIVKHGIASPRMLATNQKETDFYVFRSFAASTTRDRGGRRAPIKIKTFILEDEIVAHRANALVFDIEGAEEDIIEHADLTGIERLFFEIHPKIIGTDKAIGLVARLEENGLFLQPDCVFGDVIGFARTRPKSQLPGARVFEVASDFEAAARMGDSEAAYRIAHILLDPLADNPYFHHQRFRILRARRDPSASLAIELALSLGSQDFHLFTDYAALLMENRRFEQAGLYARQALNLFPRNPVALRQIGDCVKALGNQRSVQSPVGNA